MKNLANCTPREFLVQTNKIRKQAQRWMDITKVMDIRENAPVLSPVPLLRENATAEEIAARDEIIQKNAETLNAQAKKNISDMLDVALETNVDETVELLGMLCFISPEDVDKHPVFEYLGAFTEILNCPEVIGFFTSLMQLVQMNTSGTAKA